MVRCVHPSTEEIRDKYNSYVLQACIYFLFILILQNISYSYGNRKTSSDRDRKGPKFSILVIHKTNNMVSLKI